MKKLLIILLLFPSLSYAWSPLPVRSGWNGSVYWSTDMPIDSPGKPTGDQFVTTWDNEFHLSDELRFLFRFNKVLEIGGIWKTGELSKDWGIYCNLYADEELKKTVTNIITEIAEKVYNKFKAELITVFYYPQFRTFSVRLYPDKVKDVELHKDIAKYLEGFREEKYKEYWGK